MQDIHSKAHNKHKRKPPVLKQHLLAMVAKRVRNKIILDTTWVCNIGQALNMANINKIYPKMYRKKQTRILTY
jgi:hypothetical protein